MALTGPDRRERVCSVGGRITVKQCQTVVARRFNMTVEQLCERTRQQAIARPRQIAMYLASVHTDASLPDIAVRFAGMAPLQKGGPKIAFDHTTVMYARDRITELMAIDPDLKTEVEMLTKLLRAGVGV